MTEEEWRLSNPHRLLLNLALRRKLRPTARKLRLCGCAFMYRMIDLLEDERSVRAVQIAEQFADGLVTAKEMRAAGWKAKAACNSAAASAAHRLTYIPHSDGGRKCRKMVSEMLYYMSNAISGRRAHRDESEYQSKIIKDIFPFRATTLSPSWLTSTVLALATGIYEERAFDRMPILADALQDAGCDCEDILNHCRGPGFHCRGCFVVDLVLGKE